MTREIKFRAWDKDSKEWLAPHLIQQIGIVTDTALVLQNENSSFIELMQFTGLHDKNGKEVFEGDIIYSEFQHPVGAQWDVKGEVMWENGRYHVKGYNIYGLEDLKVIGNKYEGETGQANDNN